MTIPRLLALACTRDRDTFNFARVLLALRFPSLRDGGERQTGSREKGSFIAALGMCPHGVSCSVAGNPSVSQKLAGGRGVGLVELDVASLPFIGMDGWQGTYT